MVGRLPPNRRRRVPLRAASLESLAAAASLESPGAAAAAVLRRIPTMDGVVMVDGEAMVVMGDRADGADGAQVPLPLLQASLGRAAVEDAASLARAAEGQAVAAVAAPAGMHRHGVDLLRGDMVDGVNLLHGAQAPLLLHQASQARAVVEVASLGRAAVEDAASLARAAEGQAAAAVAAPAGMHRLGVDLLRGDMADGADGALARRLLLPQESLARAVVEAASLARAAGPPAAVAARVGTTLDGDLHPAGLVDGVVTVDGAMAAGLLPPTTMIPHPPPQASLARAAVERAVNLAAGVKSRGKAVHAGAIRN